MIDVRIKGNVKLRELFALREQLREELEAVDKVIAIAQRRSRGEQINGHPSIIFNHSDKPKREYGIVGKLIADALAKCPRQFVFADVEKNLARPLKQEQISLGLNRLGRQKKIKVATPRNGRTPAVYEKM